MQRIIIYGSEYGTTRRYAEQLSQLTGIPAMDYTSAKNLDGCELVIYLGGLYAGGVKGVFGVLAGDVLGLPEADTYITKHDIDDLVTVVHITREEAPAWQR